MATKSSSTGVPPAKNKTTATPGLHTTTPQNQKRVAGDEKKTTFKKSKKPFQQQGQKVGSSNITSTSNLPITKSSPPSSSSTPPKSNTKHLAASSSSIATATSSPPSSSITTPFANAGSSNNLELDDCNVFVKHLPATLTDEGLRSLFTKWGEIVSCRVMIDPRTKTSYGYGFVRYSNPKEAQEAIKHMNGFGIENKSLLCKLSNRSTQPGAGGEQEYGSNSSSGSISNTSSPKRTRGTYLPASTTGSADPSVSNKQVQYSTTTLYIRYLPAHIYTPEQLKSLFSRFGTVTEARVLTDPYTRLSRQVAFVRFAEEDEAKQALEEMHGKKLDFPNAKPNAAPLVVQYAQEQKNEASSEPPFKSPSKRKSKQANPVPGLSPTPRYYKPQAGLPIQQEEGDYQYIDDSPVIEGEEKELSNASTTVSSEASYANPYGNMGYYSSYPINFYPYSPHQYNPYYPYYYPYSAVPQQAPSTEVMYDGSSDNVTSDVVIDQGQEAIIDEGVIVEGDSQEHVSSDVSPAMAADEGEDLEHPVPPTKNFRKASGSSSQATPAHQDANLFIFHLPSDVDDSGLYTLFSRFGSIESVKVITDRNTGESRGYGFVKYYNLEDALTAIGAMNGFRVGKKQLTVSFKTQSTNKSPSPLMTSISSSPAPASSSVAPHGASIGKMLLWPQANTTFAPQILTKKNEEAIKASTTSTTPSDNQKDEQTSPRLQN